MLLALQIFLRKFSSLYPPPFQGGPKSRDIGGREQLSTVASGKRAQGGSIKDYRPRPFSSPRLGGLSCYPSINERFPSPCMGRGILVGRAARYARPNPRQLLLLHSAQKRGCPVSGQPLNSKSIKLFGLNLLATTHHEKSTQSRAEQQAGGWFRNLVNDQVVSNKGSQTTAAGAGAIDDKCQNVASVE